MMQWVLYLTVLCSLLASGFSMQDITCTKQTSPCSCTTAQGDIDLSPLANSDNTAKFTDIPDSKGTDAFAYNPCNNFALPGADDCSNVAVCQIQGQGTLPPSFYNLGDQDSARFITDGERGLEIQYAADTFTNVLRTAYVQLECDQNEEGKLEADGEVDKGSAEYYLKLTSKHCCPKGGGGETTTPGSNPGPGPDKPSGAFSTGGIIMIVLFSVLIVYFITGFVFMRFVRKAQGREAVPNSGFWTSIPVYIKDGALFIVRRGQRRGYDSM